MKIPPSLKSVPEFVVSFGPKSPCHVSDGFENAEGSGGGCTFTSMATTLEDIVREDVGRPRAFVAWLRGRYEMAFELEAITNVEFAHLMKLLDNIRIITDFPVSY